MVIYKLPKNEHLAINHSYHFADAMQIAVTLPNLLNSTK